MVAGLQAAVRELGGTPEDDGSFKADLHRRWLDLRAAIGGSGSGTEADRDKAIIEEVERGEDYLKAKYEAALSDTKVSGGMNAIQKAYESVRAGHDTASTLKHRMAGAPSAA